MIYLLLILIAVLLLAFFIYKWKNGDPHAKSALKMSSVIATLFLLMRATPALMVNIMMIIPMLIPLLQKRAKPVKNNSVGMTEEEARQVLGVSDNATVEEVLATFKKMMLKNHPDQGGSRYIAEQLIKAKEVLLGKNKY